MNGAYDVFQTYQLKKDNTREIAKEGLAAIIDETPLSKSQLSDILKNVKVYDSGKKSPMLSDKYFSNNKKQLYTVDSNYTAPKAAKEIKAPEYIVLR